jgi:sodium-dependent phosphate transporter
MYEDCGLYKMLLHKLHLDKVENYMADSGNKPLRYNNSYTSYTMACPWIHSVPMKMKKWRG